MIFLKTLYYLAAASVIHDLYLCWRNSNDLEVCELEKNDSSLSFFLPFPFFFSSCEVPLFVVWCVEFQTHWYTFTL